MLQNTFLHVPGIGPKTERILWKSGLLTWDDVLDGIEKSVLPPTRAKRLAHVLPSSKDALRRRDVRFFTRLLPRAYWWRLLPEFLDQTAFLDIETTGLSKYYDQITLIGLFDGTRPRFFLRGANLDDIRKAIRNVGILVTFNGSLFDLPFMKAKLQPLKFPPAHLDLRFLLRRIGLNGGLKQIERQVGIHRDPEVADFDGYDMTILWRRYCRGDEEALKMLVKYNMEDTTNLQLLLAHVWRKLRDMTIQDLKESGIQTAITDVLLDKERLFSEAFPNLEDNLPVKPDVTIRRRRKNLVKLKVGRLRSMRVHLEDSRQVSFAALLEKIGRGPPAVVGIDLSAAPKRRTGWALIHGKEVQTAMPSTDEEILDLTFEANPDLVSIDSPLGLPAGRDCTSDSCECRKYGIIREAERILKRRGINVYPSLLPSMQRLTERGILLADKLREHGYTVIESYPGAAQDILQILRKKVDLNELRLGLESFGIPLDPARERRLTHDELDATTSALVGYFYIAGLYEALGPPEEGELIIPRLG